MRLIFYALGAACLSSCATSPATDGPTRYETARLERQHGELGLRAGGAYADERGFIFVVGYSNSDSELGPASDVSWTVKLLDYCRDRPSWVESVVIGPAGQKWRGYRVAVPAGPTRRQDWSSGSDGAARYGGPSTPGLLEAVEQGGRFTLALEDDAGVRHNAVVIDTLTPPQREALFQAMPAETRQARPDPTPLIAVEAAPLSAGPATCPNA